MINWGETLEIFRTSHNLSTGMKQLNILREEERNEFPFSFLAAEQKQTALQLI